MKVNKKYSEAFVFFIKATAFVVFVGFLFYGMDGMVRDIYENGSFLSNFLGRDKLFFVNYLAGLVGVIFVTKETFIEIFLEK